MALIMLAFIPAFPGVKTWSPARVAFADAGGIGV